MRRLSRARADPETAAVHAVLDRYEAMLRVLAEAGDRWAPERLRGVRWTRWELDEWGLGDFVIQLRVKGYERELDRLGGGGRG